MQKSFFPYFSSLWNNLDVKIQLLPLYDFKVNLKDELKPRKYRHFGKGSKIGNRLLTRIRLEISDLNSHKFAIGQSEYSECLCHSKYETSQHYLIDCFLFSCERQTLFDQVEHFIPNFKNFSKSLKYKILVMGINTDDPDFNRTNTSISIAVQNYILKSKRFPDS